MTTFNKPEKSNSDLIIEWKKRGLLIPDEQRALRYLDFMGKRIKWLILPLHESETD